jgi:hypothetical protein
MIAFLPTALDNVSFETFYTQNVIEWSLDLLAKAID